MESEKSVMAVIRASRPSFRNSNDKLAFVLHASFLSSGFVLTATGPPAFAHTPLSSSTTDEVGIDHWNEVEDEYAFIYMNPEKSNKKVLVKCLVMGDKMMVDALSDGGATPVHLEIDVGEYVAENAGNDYNSQYKNLGKLVTSIQSDILSKLDGDSAGTSTNNAPRSRAAEEPNRNYDEPDYSPENPSRFVVPPVNPIGGSDLFPGGGAGIYPSRGDFGGGSMLVGPHDPRWFGGRGGLSGNPGGLGGVPPGARFDPYGPPGVPGFEPTPGRFPRGPFPDTGGVNPDFGPVPGRAPRGRIHPDLEQPGSGGFDYI